MQVKKFEARTMKEALEMVKVQLGPEAIILSARDNHRSFGLVGEGSVEITAAISEESLQKRKFAQSKLREQDRQRFDKSPAKMQRALIEQVVQNHTQKNQYRPITTKRYIDIEEENVLQDLSSSQNFNSNNEVETNLNPVPPSSFAQLRIKDAAQKAWQAMNFNTKPSASKTATSQGTNAAESAEILSLRNEISSLKKMLGEFQTVPQSIVGQHPGATYGINYDFSFLFEKLHNEGIEDTDIIELLGATQSAIPSQHHKNRSLLEGFLARKMMEKTLIANHEKESKFHFFFGPTGSGKTSTMVKMASHKVINENKRVALITTDTIKVGAVDQLRIFSQILNVPFAVIRNSNDWVKLRNHLDQLDHVFVDFTGSNLKNENDIATLESCIPNSYKDITRHLVLSALGKFEDLNNIAAKYRRLSVNDLIITNIDQCAQFGNIYTLMNRQNLPLHSFGTGSRLPEDLEHATKERLLDLILKITRNNYSAENKAVGESR